MSYFCLSFQEPEAIQTAVVCPHRDNCYSTLRSQQVWDKHPTTTKSIRRLFYLIKGTPLDTYVTSTPHIAK